MIFSRAGPFQNVLTFTVLTFTVSNGTVENFTIRFGPGAVQQGLDVLGYENAEQLEMLGGNAVVNVDDGTDEILQQLEVSSGLSKQSRAFGPLNSDYLGKLFNVVGRWTSTTLTFVH